jgi:hypothetical protein
VWAEGDLGGGRIPLHTPVQFILPTTLHRGHSIKHTCRRIITRAEAVEAEVLYQLDMGRGG